MHGVDAAAEVVICGSVTAESAWRLWLTLEAASAMYCTVTVNLAHAASIDHTVLADLLAKRDDLAACDRTLALNGLTPSDGELSSAVPSARPTQPGPVSPCSARPRSVLRQDPDGSPGGPARLPTAAKRNGRPARQDRDVEERLLGGITARLRQRFPLLPQGVVEDAVRHRYGIYGTASIRDFVPILVEREVGDHLGDLTTSRPRDGRYSHVDRMPRPRRQRKRQ